MTTEERKTDRPPAETFCVVVSSLNYSRLAGTSKGMERSHHWAKIYPSRKRRPLARR